MNNTTAVILSRFPLEQVVVPGSRVLNHVVTVRNHIEMNAARRAAVAQVETPHWFFLDADDQLPLDFSEVLADCLSEPVAIAYTDELVLQRGAEPFRRTPGSYDQQAHIKNLLSIHHLVVCDTEATRAAMKALPQGGIEMFELMLYFQLAKQSVRHVPRIGYHWLKGEGFHTKPDALRSVCMAAVWCARNRT